MGRWLRVISFALVLCAPVAWAEEDLDKAREYFQQGVQYFNSGKYDEALEAFKNSGEYNPRSAETFNNIGAIYDEFGMLAQAEEYFQKARRLNPDYELAHYNLARLYLNMAREEYAHVARLTADPERAEEARHYLQIIDSVLVQEPPPANGGSAPPPAERPEPAPEPGTLAPAGSMEALFQEAKLAHANGDLDVAIQRYREIAKARPDDAHVQYNLGSALFSQGDYDGALAAFDRVIALNPNNAESYHFRGATLEKLGRASEAIEALKRSVAIEDTYKARWLLGVIYEQAGDYASAVQEFEAVARMEPENKKIQEYLEEARMILAMKGGGEAPAAPPADPWQAQRAWLEGWRQAWESRDLNAYMSFYSEAFSARGKGGNKSKADWRKEKGRKFKRAEPKVKISDLRVDKRDGLLIFSFVQDYRNRGYADRGMKKLFVRDEGGKLKIVSEEWRKL